MVSSPDYELRVADPREECGYRKFARALKATPANYLKRQSATHVYDGRCQRFMNWITSLARRISSAQSCNMGLEGRSRPALSGWQVEALNQGQEPEAPRL
jgi:hypothetical protein